MNATKLIELMNQRPFQPLEVRLADGQSLKIDEPFNVAVARSQPTFIVYDEAGPTHYVAYRNVTQVITQNPAVN